MKKYISILLVLVMLLLVGCGTQEPANTAPNPGTEDPAPSSTSNVGTEGSKKEPIKVGFSSQNLSDSFMKTIFDTVKTEVESRGDLFVGVGAEGDGALQISQIEDLINQEVDVLIVNPVSADGILPALEQCKTAGIPVITYDSAANDRDLLISHVATDNTDCGRLVGQYVLDNITTDGKVITVTAEGMESVLCRTNGFKEAIAGSNIELVEAFTGGDINNLIEDLIIANPDAVCFFSISNTVATIAAAYLEQYGMSESCPIVTVDGSPDDKVGIKEGTILCAAAQSPVSIAEKCVETLYTYLEGGAVDAEYLLPSFLITGENVEQYGYDGWQ